MVSDRTRDKAGGRKRNENDGDSRRQERGEAEGRLNCSRKEEEEEDSPLSSVTPSLSVE